MENYIEIALKIKDTPRERMFELIEWLRDKGFADIEIYYLIKEDTK